MAANRVYFGFGCKHGRDHRTHQPHKHTLKWHHVSSALRALYTVDRSFVRCVFCGKLISIKLKPKRPESQSSRILSMLKQHCAVCFVVDLLCRVIGVPRRNAICSLFYVCKCECGRVPWLRPESSITFTWSRLLKRPIKRTSERKSVSERGRERDELWLSKTKLYNQHRSFGFSDMSFVLCAYVCCALCDLWLFLSSFIFIV